MDFIVKHKLKNALKNIFLVVVVMVILFFVIWCCLVITDYIRFMENKPLIFVENIIYDRTDGYVNESNGIGYKWVDSHTTSNTTSIFYIFNKAIKMK